MYMVVFQEGGASDGIPTLYGHGEGSVDLADGADTLEGLGLGLADKLQELMLQRGVVEHRLAEDGVEAIGGDKRRQDDVSEEAFGTMAAPDVLLAAGVA